MKKITLQQLNVENSFLEFDEQYYDFAKISSLNGAKLASFNKYLAEQLQLDHENIKDEEIVDILNGKKLLNNSKPYAMVYAGHQFGYFVPQLGDGRAINIGSYDGWHFQLKGSGITKYSRHGDGKAVLRSSIREYLMSEAMYGLGIPTTRALAIISSDHPVYRDMEFEKGAIVLRVSPSWIRIGTFEYFYLKKNRKDLQQLANYVIKQNYSHLIDKEEEKYETLFFEIVDGTANLIAKWMAYGFMHGVMNTDNMSVASVTIDYGPFAFMDRYDAGTICNHTDKEGRYSYENQPFIAQWNLSSLYNAMKPLFEDEEKANEYLQMFMSLYQHYYYELMNKKLGLQSQKSGSSNKKLIKDLLKILQGSKVDYTVFFRRLSSNDDEQILQLCKYTDPMQQWLKEYKNIRDNQGLDFEKIASNMNKINPKYILKNYILQEVIDKANKDDFSLLNDLLDIAHTPFDEHPNFEHYAQPTPQNVNNLRLSCSS